MKTVLVTGASGFIGRALCPRLMACGLRVSGTVRTAADSASLPHGVTPVITGTFDASTDWRAALSGVDTVVHLAARVHVLRNDLPDPLAAYHAANTLTTASLARQAAEHVRRLVFLSSVKVNGEGRPDPYSEDDLPTPEDPYGVSKWQAEIALRNIGKETGLETVILRPPLVYGPGVKANFHRLLKLVNRGLPLPLANVRNSRSLLFVGNLVDAIAVCATHPKAAHQTFLVRDGEDVSTPELIQSLAAALGRPARLFPIPASLWHAIGILSGRGDSVARLLGTLSINDSLIRQELEWNPPFAMKQGLTETAAWFKSTLNPEGAFLRGNSHEACF